MKEELPFVTVGIITKNEAEFIEETISSILNLDYPEDKYEIVIVDGNSTDGTQEKIKQLIKKNKKIRLFIEPWKNGTHGRARNYVADNAIGKYIAFTDGDCVVDRNWLRILVESIEKERNQCEKVVAVGGIRRPIKTDKWKENLINYIFSTFFGCGGSTGFMSTKKKYIESIPNYNSIYVTEIIRKIRYSDDLGVGEDAEFNLRLNINGYKIVFNNNAVVYHHQKNSIIEFLKQMFNYGKARVKIYRKIKRIPYFAVVSPLFVLTLLLGLILSFFSPLILKIYISVLIFYFFLDLIFTLKVFFKIKKLYGILAIFIYPLQHISYGLGVLEELLFYKY